MKFLSTLTSLNHIKHPFSHVNAEGNKVSISNKKVRVVALSLLVAAVTGGIGGLLLFYSLSAKYKVNKLDNLQTQSEARKANEIAQKTSGQLLALPNELIDEISTHLTVYELKEVAQICQPIQERAGLRLIKRAQQLNLDAKDVEQARKSLSSLFKPTKKLAKRGFLSKNKIVYRTKKSKFLFIHYNQKKIDVEKTLDNLECLTANELLYIYKRPSIYGVKGIREFNKFISNSKITETDSINKSLLSNYLISAVKAGDENMTRLLIGLGADPKLQLPKGDTLLHLAAKSKHTEALKVLLSAGCDPNQSNFFGETPLLAAVDHTINEDVVKLLLDKGANPNLPNNLGVTPLIRRLSHPTFVKLFLNYGADVNYKTHTGDTALQIAQKRGYRESAKILAEAIQP